MVVMPPVRWCKRGVPLEVVVDVVVVVVVLAVVFVVVVAVVVAVVEYIIILIIIVVGLLDFAQLQFCQTVNLESLFFFKPLVFLRKMMTRRCWPFCCWLVFLWPAG